MSDIMLQGVLRMPPELWVDSPIDILQRHGRYIQAADRLEELERLLKHCKMFILEKKGYCRNEENEIEAGNTGHITISVSRAGNRRSKKNNGAVRRRL